MRTTRCLAACVVSMVCRRCGSTSHGSWLMIDGLWALHLLRWHTNTGRQIANTGNPDRAVVKTNMRCFAGYRSPYVNSVCSAGIAAPPPMAPGYGDMTFAQQSSTPPWLQVQNMSTMWSPPGGARMSPGGLSPAHVYPDGGASLPQSAPADAVGYQPWQIEESIAECISTTMAVLGQEDWAVCAPLPSCRSAGFV